MADNTINEDGVQHGIDYNPHGDAGKGALLGGLGGAAVGALAGGPIGAIIGAVAGAIGSGAAVAAVDNVDNVDNDNTVSGIGAGATGDVNASHNQHSNEPSIADQILGGGNTTPSTTDTNYGAPTTMNNNLNDDLNTVSTNTADVTDRDTIRVPVMKEELDVQKTMQQVGEVQVRKDVVTEQVSVPVEVAREEVVVTRHASRRRPSTVNWRLAKPRWVRKPFAFP